MSCPTVFGNSAIVVFGALHAITCSLNSKNGKQKIHKRKLPILQREAIKLSPFTCHFFLVI